MRSVLHWIPCYQAGDLTSHAHRIKATTAAIAAAEAENIIQLLVTIADYCVPTSRHGIKRVPVLTRFSAWRAAGPPHESDPVRMCSDRHSAAHFIVGKGVQGDASEPLRY